MLLVRGHHPVQRVHPPAWFVAQALCVHSGWHWSPVSPRRGAPVEYVISGRGWYRTYDVPDGYPGGSGEGAWNSVSSWYGGGMQFTLGTWNRAAALSRGLVRYARSTWDIAHTPPLEQIEASFLIVREDHWSWREWPQTSRACGYS